MFKTKINVSQLLLAILLTSCSYYADNFKAKSSGKIDLQKDGYISANFLQRNDSVFLSITNISGNDIINFSYLVQLYTESTKTRSSLFFSKIEKVNSLSKNSVQPIAFLTKTKNGISNSSIRFEIISINRQGFFTVIGGLLEGSYRIESNTTNKSVSNLCSGYLTYKGDFLFETNGSDKTFTFFSGVLKSDSSYLSYFLNTDGTVINNQSGSYRIVKDSLDIPSINLNSEKKVFFKLKNTAQ